MTIEMQPAALDDLQEVFDHYRAIRPILGDDFITEFRRSVDQMLAFPRAWQRLDETYRRCRLRRFPYGVIYRIDEQSAQLVVIGILNLNRDFNAWRRQRG